MKDRELISFNIYNKENTYLYGHNDLGTTFGRTRQNTYHLIILEIQFLLVLIILRVKNQIH